MNHLLIGHGDKAERLLQIAKPPFLIIGEHLDDFIEEFPHAKVFDVQKNHFNPLRNIDHKKARDFSALLYGISPQGENTLTVRNGKRALTKLLLEHHSYLHKLPRTSDPEALGMVDDLLLSPLVRLILCQPTNFSFKASVIANLDRAALGDFDALVLGCLIIGEYKGQVIVPDFGFYGLEIFMSLIRQNRLICGLNYLSEVSEKMQQAVLGITDKTIYRTSREDAQRLIVYTKHTEPNILVNLTGDSYEIGA